MQERDSQQQKRRPVVPAFLREFLSEPLKNLQEEALTEQSRAALSEEVLKEVRAALPRIRAALGNRYLPVPAVEVPIGNLDISIRTYNCLLALGVENQLSLIGELTLDDLLKTRNFGVKSLLDLLTALESVEVAREVAIDEPVAPAQPQAAPPDPWVTSEDILKIQNCAERQLPIPAKIRQKCLPPLPEELRLNRLGLKRRTYHCLETAGYAREPRKLSKQSLHDLLRSLRGFGKESLADLLTALEPYLCLARNREAEPSRAQELTDVVTRLLEIPAIETITPDDVRLGQLLRAIVPVAANVRDAGEKLLTGDYVPYDVSTTIRRIEQLTSQLEALAQLSLEEELNSLLPPGRSARDRQMFSRRYGLDGAPELTLQEVGKEFGGMTRERVRQICERIEGFFSNTFPYAPALDKAIDFVFEKMPELADEMESRLQASGIARTAFRMESLHNAARLFGREAPYAVVKTSQLRTVVAEDAAYSAKHLIRIARRATEHWGVVNIEEVASQAAEKFAFSTDFVARTLTRLEDFRWLDEASGWFWLASVPRNRLLTQIEKILAVARKIHVAELREGVRRHHRMEGFAPPQRVLLALCHQVSSYRVEGRWVSVVSLLDWQEVLSDTERLMVEILSAAGSVMPREKLEDACIAGGMNRTTFYLYLGYSALITKHSRGVYGLRGAEVSPGLVESLRIRSGRGRVLKDAGWTSSGEVWIAYQLSGSSVASGVCSVPAAFREAIQGDFALYSGEGSPIGTLSTNDTSVWGLRPLFSRRGAEEGDFLVLLFNLSSRSVSARLGDETVLDEFQNDSAEFAVDLS